MPLIIAAAAVLTVGLLGLAMLARRQHRTALAGRAALLDDVCALLDGPRVTAGADGFPIAVGRLADGLDVRIVLIPDSLVTRRLPQLWMAVTIRDARLPGACRYGALARPTGAEYLPCRTASWR